MRPRPPGARARPGDRRADNSLGCQQTFDGEVQRMSGVEREDHPRLVTDMKRSATARRVRNRLREACSDSS